MADVKVTKRDILAAVRLVAENGAVDFGTVSADDVIAYVDTTIAQLDAKAAKAKERAAKNKTEGDELRATVEGVLTDELQTIDAITTAVQAVEGYEDVTKSKITARLTQLTKAGAAFKAQVKTEDGRKVMAYTNIEPVSTDEDAE